jgi:hydrogenase maturation protein HypF
MKEIKTITVEKNFKVPVFAVGAELKSSFAFGYKNKILILENKIVDDEIKMLNIFKKNYFFLTKKVGVKPKVIVYDMHPNYLSTKFALQLAKNLKTKTFALQHHYTHMVSCMVENKIGQPCIGIIFDGTGYGTDGTIWGSEFIIGDVNGKFFRCGYFDYIDLLNGDLGIKQPYRNTIAFLYKNYGNNLVKLKFWKKFKDEFSDYKDRFEGIKYLVDNNTGIIKSCGMGRIFDIVAVLCGIGFVNNFEGELPIKLEKVSYEMIDEIVKKDKSYDYEIMSLKNKTKVVDTNKLLLEIVKDLESGKEKNFVSSKFHYTICKISLDIALKLRKEFKINKVVFSGGVFQNKILSSLLTQMLTNSKFEVYHHKNVPCNDLGISVGQVVVEKNKNFS